MRLTDMKMGSWGRVRAVGAGPAGYRQRLAAMGLLPGTVFHVSRIAPLGDPVEITFRGFALVLRKHEANVLEIDEVSNL